MDTFDDRLKIHDSLDNNLKLEVESLHTTPAAPNMKSKLDILPLSSSKENVTLKFNDVDSLVDTNNKEEKLLAPKDVDTLEKKYEDNHKDDYLEDDDDGEKLKIGETITTNLIEPISLNNIVKKDAISLSGIELS